MRSAVITRQGLARASTARSRTRSSTTRSRGSVRRSRGESSRPPAGRPGLGRGHHCRFDRASAAIIRDMVRAEAARRTARTGQRAALFAEAGRAGQRRRRARPRTTTIWAWVHPSVDSDRAGGVRSGRTSGVERVGGRRGVAGRLPGRGDREPRGWLERLPAGFPRHGHRRKRSERRSPAGGCWASTAGQYGAAIGLAATTAAGVKASFGTMAKHLNAGNAAANGLAAAELAARGFTAAADGLQGEQGFLATHGDLSDVDLARPYDVLGPSDAVTQLLYKVHASCGGTHATIGIRSGRARRAGRGGRRRDCRRRGDRKRGPDRHVRDPRATYRPGGQVRLRYNAALALSGAGTGREASPTRRSRPDRLPGPGPRTVVASAALRAMVRPRSR